MEKKFNKLCRKIKIILTDVDGVLTDGSRFYSTNGECVKNFHVRDGMGVNILLRNNIKTIIITKENSEIVRIWASDVNISKMFSGIKKKELILSTICEKYNVSNNEIAFIGDDVNDLKLLELVGFSASPSDAALQIRNHVNYVCESSGGHGAFREFADLILSIKFPRKRTWY